MANDDVMKTGYRIDEENRSQVLEDCLVIPQRLRAMELPDKVDWTWTTMHQQVKQDCGAHGLTTIMEAIRFGMTGERDYQFSRQFAYNVSRERSGSGWINQDAGVTVEGTIRAAKIDGGIPEEQMPYTSQDVNRTPQHLRELGRECTLVETVAVPTPRDACTVIARGGGIAYGIPWLQSFAREIDGHITSVGGASLGGHYVCSVGYMTIEGGIGLCPVMTNSHGSQWAKAGHAVIHPNVYDWMYRNGTIVGLVGLRGVATGPFDWTDPEQSIFAR